MTAPYRRRRLPGPATRAFLLELELSESTVRAGYSDETVRGTDEELLARCKAGER